MNGRVLIGWMAAFLLVAGGARPALAQKVGAFERIAVAKGDTVPQLPRRDGEVERLRPALIARDSSLLAQDIVRIYSDVIVQALFDVDANRSEVYFRRKAGTSRGSYEVLPEGIETLSSLALSIKLGTLVVKRKTGTFVACLLKKCAVVPGSTVLFEVTEEDSVGRIYLREGSLRMPECGIDIADGREIAWTWDLRVDECPRLLPLPRPERRSLRREVKYTTHTVWQRRRPLYRRPGFYLPLLVGTTATVACALLCNGGDNERNTEGTVIVTIP